jgi:hypothetical protein
MALPSRETLALIQWLATRNREQLLALAELRRLNPSDLSSLTTVAQALLGENSVKAALSKLSRSTLLALTSLTGDKTPTPELDRLEESGLVSTQGEGAELLFPASHLKGLVREVLSPKLAKPKPCRGLSASEIQSSAGLVQALLAQLCDVLDALAKRPYPANKTGALTATGQKTLADILGSGYDIPGLIRLGTTAHLFAAGPEGMLATPLAIQWRSQPGEEQWSNLAVSWWNSLPAWLTALVLEHPELNWDSDLTALVSYHYPLLESEEAVEEHLSQATLLGVLHSGCPTPWGTQLWHPTGTLGLVEHFVEPGLGVYASEDFTLIASAPLLQQHRVILDSLAHRELGGLIPRYRVTARSLVRALQSGVEPGSIIPSLQTCALTALPGGMVHLIEDTCRRAGEIKLHRTRNGTTLTVARTQLKEELLLDPSLNGLALRELDELNLASPLPIERVNDFILGSRYLALVDTKGDKAAAVPSQSPSAVTPPSAVNKAVTTLHDTIESAARHGVPPSLGSVLEVAIASKVPLDIRVEMPGGELIELIMEPRSVGSGRLRGVELKNSMEKTIPVSSIRSAVPWLPEGS